jgi:TPR repeat protein
LVSKVKGLYITDRNSYEGVLKSFLNVSALIEASKDLNTQFDGYKDLVLAEKILYYMIVKGNINLDEYISDIKDKTYIESLKKIFSFRNETPSETIKWLKEAADQEFIYANRRAGVLYFYGEGVPEDKDLALYWFKKAADKGDVGAMNDLGVLYANGLGVPQSFAKAMEFFQKASDKGHAQAIYNIGGFYARGLGVPQSFAKAMEFFQKASDKDNTSAMTNIGSLYMYGLGVPQSYNEAMEWYKKAAGKGDCKGYFFVGKNFLKQKNFQKAKECFEFILNTQEDISNYARLYALGCIYSNGYDVVKENKSMALECFEKAYKINPWDLEIQYSFAKFLEDFSNKDIRIKELYQKAGFYISKAREKLNKILHQEKLVKIQKEVLTETGVI